MKRVILMLMVAIFSLSVYSCRETTVDSNSAPELNDRRNGIDQDTMEVNDPMQEVREESGDPVGQ